MALTGDSTHEWPVFRGVEVHQPGILDFKTVTGTLAVEEFAGIISVPQEPVPVLKPPLEALMFSEPEHP